MDIIERISPFLRQEGKESICNDMRQLLFYHIPGLKGIGVVDLPR
jgi:hypothetical protein